MDSWQLSQTINSSAIATMDPHREDEAPQRHLLLHTQLEVTISGPH
jgi:hypothetical protein